MACRLEGYALERKRQGVVTNIFLHALLIPHYHAICMYHVLLTLTLIYTSSIRIIVICLCVLSLRFYITLFHKYYKKE